MRSKELQYFYRKLAARSKELEEFYESFKPEYDDCSLKNPYRDTSCDLRATELSPPLTNSEPEVMSRTPEESNNNIIVWENRAKSKTHLTRDQLLSKPLSFLIGSENIEDINNPEAIKWTNIFKEYLRDLDFPLSVTRSVLLPIDVIQNPNKLVKEFSKNMGSYWVPNSIIESRDPERLRSSYYSHSVVGYYFLNLIATIEDENSVNWSATWDDLLRFPADIAGILVYPNSTLNLNEVRFYDVNGDFLESDKVDFMIKA